MTENIRVTVPIRPMALQAISEFLTPSPCAAAELHWKLDHPAESYGL